MLEITRDENGNVTTVGGDPVAYGDTWSAWVGEVGQTFYVIADDTAHEVATWRCHGCGYAHASSEVAPSAWDVATWAGYCASCHAVAKGAQVCTTCGDLCAPAGSGLDLPATARTVDDDVICGACAAVLTRDALRRRDSVAAYLSADLRTLTTWDGRPLARVTRTGEYRTAFGRVTTWRARTPEGQNLYGRGAGAGMATMVRYAKA